MFSTFICILFKHTEAKVLKAWQFYSSDKLNYYLNNYYIPEKTLIYLVIVIKCNSLDQTKVLVTNGIVSGSLVELHKLLKMHGIDPARSEQTYVTGLPLCHPCSCWSNTLISFKSVT